MKKKMNHTVVAAADLTPFSKTVVSQACLLAETMHWPLVVVFVYEDVVGYEDVVALDRAHITKIYTAELRSFYNLNPTYRVVVRFGRASRELIAAAKREQNPLLVLGGHSGHKVAKFFLGSVAESVAALAPFPVWVHRGSRVVVPKTILVPSDLSAKSDQTIRAVTPLQKAFGAKLEVFHVLADPTPILNYQAWVAVFNAMKTEDDRKIRAFRKKHPGLNTIRVRGSVVEDIQDHGAKFDLIAITPRAKPRGTFGSVTRKIVHAGTNPVLVVP